MKRKELLKEISMERVKSIDLLCEIAQTLTKEKRDMTNKEKSKVDYNLGLCDGLAKAIELIEE